MVGLSFSNVEFLHKHRLYIFPLSQLTIFFKEDVLQVGQCNIIILLNLFEMQRRHP